MYKILVVDDEPKIREVIKEYAEFSGFEVTEAEDGMSAVGLCKLNDYDLIVMDIMMPKLDGFSACKEIRKTKDIPTIMLSARGEEYDKLFGFELGIDDYVVKPFSPKELMARVNSQLRRYKRFMEKLQKQEAENADSVYTIGGLEVNETTFEVRVDGALVKMTPMEFRILLLLIKNPGRVFSADEIYERVWNERAVNTETVMVHVRNIREKIEINPKVPKYLKVVWGVGYKIEKIS